MGDITSADRAWEDVKKAAREGVFVPVLGPELAADPTFTQAPHAVLDNYLQNEEERASQQSRELLAISTHQDRLIARINSVSPKVSPVAYWPLLRPKAAGKLDRDKLTNYLEQLHWPGVGAHEGDADVWGALTPQSLLYEDFLCDVALLALALKRAWTGSLMNDSRPLSAMGPDTVVEDASRIEDEKIQHVFAACLEACGRLWEASQSSKWEEPCGLRLEWVYSKLLLLGSQVFGKDPRLLWDKGPAWAEASPRDFIKRHRQMLSRGQLTTGWAVGMSGTPVPSQIHRFELGPRLTHAVWAESLVRHVLLAGTRAYRTSEQLAFLLSLNDKAIDLPDMSVDPFEVALLRGPRHGEDNDDIEVLKGIYKFAEMSEASNGSQARRLPGAFHQAIARITREMLDTRAKEPRTGGERRRRGNAASAGPTSDKALILTMALDTEMERALEREFNSYRVLIPVYLPLKGPRRWDPTWVLGEFILEQDVPSGPRKFSCPRWTMVTERGNDEQNKADVAGKGPLLIKLFGSPLTDVGTGESYASANPDIDAGGEVKHRVVLDETELLSLLKESLPLQVRGLIAKFGGSSLFFFGQNAVKWSDRIPYLIVGALRDPALDGGNKGDAPAVETNEGLGPQGSGHARVVAFAKRSEYGDSLFSRLKVDRNVDLAVVDEIAHEIMRGVVNGGIWKDPNGTI